MVDAEQELKFAKTLEGVRQAARAQGNQITAGEVREAFAHQDLTEEQYQLIFDYLKKHKIGVDEAVDFEDYLTAAEKNYLADYLNGLKSLRQYSEAEKKAALVAAIAGEPAGQQELVEIYLPQVAEIAKLYTEQGVFLEDLVGEGNVALTAGVTMLTALLDGTEPPEEAEGVLVSHIMTAMEELIADTDRLQRADQKMTEQVNQVAVAATELTEALGRKVTVAELAAEYPIPPETIWEVLRISGNAIEDIEDGK